jgi:hypothetical protein
VHWVFLGLAGVFEIGFTACLKMSNGFTRLWWSLAFILSAGISFIFLNLSIAVIPLAWIIHERAKRGRGDARSCKARDGKRAKAYP